MTSSRETGRHASPAAGGHGLRASIGRWRNPPKRAAVPRSGWARGLRIGARVVAALVSTAIVVGSGWASYELRSFTSNVSVGAAVAAGTGQPATGSTELHRDLNILLLGNDSRAGATPAELQALGTQEDGGSSNTDTMLLLHLPADGSRATAVSFPRDSYVQIPGYGKGKLNSAYPDGYQTATDQGVTDETAKESAGIAVLTATLGELTGMQIDHYIQVNLLGFYRISLALKGVQVCLKEAVKEPNSGIDLPAGTQDIEGTQALAFVRQRYGFPDGQGDIDRIRRQQYFLSAVLRQVLSAGTLLNPSTVSNLLDAVSSSLLIDSGLQANLLALASRVSELSAGNVNFYTIPLAGSDDNSPAGAVLLVDPAAVKTFVQNAFFPPAATPSTGTGSATPTTPATTGSPSTGASSSDTGFVDPNPTAVNAADADCIY